MENQDLNKAVELMKEAMAILNASGLNTIEYADQEVGHVRWTKPYPVPQGMVGSSLDQAANV